MNIAQNFQESTRMAHLNLIIVISRMHTKGYVRDIHAIRNGYRKRPKFNEQQIFYRQYANMRYPA